MKLSLIVLLGLCVGVITGQPFKYSTFETTELKEKVKQYAEESIQDILKKQGEFGHEISNIIPNIIEIMTEVVNFIHKIGDLAGNDVISRDCHNQYKDLITEINIKFNHGVAVCLYTAQAEVFQLNLLVEYDAIRNGIKKIQEYIKDLDNIIDDENATSKILKIRDQIKVTYEPIKARIIILQEKVSIISSSGQQCTRNGNEEVMPELTEIMQKIQNCIAENQF